MKFVEKHFDKILTAAIFLIVFGGYLIYGLPDVLTLSKDVLLIYAVLVRERPKTETNVDADRAVVNQNPPTDEIKE